MSRRKLRAIRIWRAQPLDGMLAGNSSRGKGRRDWGVIQIRQMALTTDAPHRSERKVLKRMRRIWMAAGLASVLALSVAPTAGAHKFVASRLPKPLSAELPGKIKGIGLEGEKGIGERGQYLQFGAFRILCNAKAKANSISEGAVSWAFSSTLSTEVSFTKCLTIVQFPGFKAGLPTKFGYNPETKKIEPIKIVYHQNGFAEIGTGETEGEVEVAPGSSTFGIAPKICKISWPAQTVPVKAIKKPEGEYSAAVFSNKFVPVPEKEVKNFPPKGEQERLLVANAFKGMEWHYESGQCLGEGGFEEEAKKTEGKTATWLGNLELWVNKGNLGFE